MAPSKHEPKNVHARTDKERSIMDSYCKARPYLYQTSAAKRTSRGLQVYFSEFTKVDLRFLYLDTSKTYQKLSFSNFF